MSFDEKFQSVRQTVYTLAPKFFQSIAKFFGYPENPGMPVKYATSNDLYQREFEKIELPTHTTFFPPQQEAKNWLEVLLGSMPKVDTITRYVYENKEEGFYNFYIENYKNLYFLPDWMSKFFQLQLNQCLDISLLETMREILFLGFIIYYQVVLLRITIAWLIYINPYNAPWFYLVALVDWTEEVMTGLIPSVLGVNLTGTIFLGFLGALGDSLNHIVFTMPFLPSEGEYSQIAVGEELKDVIIFHYLPALWYKYPIPNEIRTFWYFQKPEILEYMQTAYQDLGIQFLPN